MAALDDYSASWTVRLPTQGQTSNADGIYVFTVGTPGETAVAHAPGRLEGVAARHALLRGTIDPSERTILRRQFVVETDGLAELRAGPLPEGAPTGRYRLDLQTPMPTALRSCSVSGPCGWRNSSPTP